MNHPYEAMSSNPQPVAQQVGQPSLQPHLSPHAMNQPQTVLLTYATAAPRTNAKPNPLGLAGGILGVVTAVIGLFLGWLLPFVVAPLAVVAIALSAEGIRRANRDGVQKGWAVAGLSTAIPSLVLSSMWLVILMLAAAAGA